jgi:NAD-dependent dihydropyrimidine dehydrogenase PreA subunit
MTQRRKIIRIDEEKCDGCGQCADACAEGAIQMIGGKARLVSESYCDGLGVCIGECPRGAIAIEEREAAEFDADAVKRHPAHRPHDHAKKQAHPPIVPDVYGRGHVCSGSLAQTLRPNKVVPRDAGGPQSEATASALGNWPVQIRLVPVRAPYFDGAHLLITADCVPFAFPDFHRRLLAGKTVLIGCPKLDDPELYRQKLAEIFRQNDIQSVEVAHMEVPCCFGLVQIVKSALAMAGRQIPLILRACFKILLERRPHWPCASGTCDC